MLLAFDVGNTQTHFGAFDGETLVDHWRFATRRTATHDELTIVIAAMLRLGGLSLDDVDGAIVSSVVPLLSNAYEIASERHFKGSLRLVGPAMKTGMPIRIDNPRELGSDRLINAIAAYDRHGEACIVVDFGTSTNFDVVSAEGEYLGGVLAPGVDISMEALFARAARLTKVELEEPRTVIGKNTQDALKSGAVYGFAGQVDGIVRRVRDEMGEREAHAIATGGLAQAIVPHCDEIDEIDDLLTLTGLRLIHELNR